MKSLSYNFYSGWNGVNRHENQRATMIAEEWGYVGFAADVYGVGFHDVVDVEERTKLGRTYRANPSLFMRRIQLAIEEVKGMDNVIKDKIGVIGYCFGGTGALMYALLSDTNDVLGSVSVHGGMLKHSRKLKRLTYKLLPLWRIF